MKVAMFTTWETKCGIADYSCQFKTALEKTGTTVTIVPVSPKKGVLDFIRLGKTMNDANIAHIQHEFSFFANAFMLRSFVNCLLFLRQINIPKVLTMHEVVPIGKNLGKFPYLRLYEMIFSSVDVITVHTDKHRRTILKMGVNDDKVKLIPIPVPKTEPLSNTKEHYKALLGVDGKKVFTVFGFLNNRKGYELVLDAIKDLDDCVFLIAGGTHSRDKSGYSKQLMNRIRDMKLDQKTKILGYLTESQITNVMGATDIILAPFRDMPGSASLSLGLAYGKAIIGSDIEQMKELQSRGIGVELFQLNKKGGLQEKIVELTGDTRRQAELEQLSRSYADKYSYSNTAVRLGELYASLLSR